MVISAEDDVIALLINLRAPLEAIKPKGIAVGRIKPNEPIEPEKAGKICNSSVIQNLESETKVNILINISSDGVWLTLELVKKPVIY